MNQSYIVTASGGFFNFEEPESSVFTIKDVAHALAHTCRFNGRTRDFYSVAQHSYMVSYIVPEQYALQGLLHDAAEAFIGDVTTPLKRLLPDYKALEKRIEAVVLGAFGISPDLHASVKEADLIMLATEKRFLMPPTAENWPILEGVRPLDHLSPWDSHTGYAHFMARYLELTK